jgi:pilus assembly protein CpaC
MKRSITISLFLLAGFFTVFTGYASEDVEEIRLYMNEPKVISVNNPTRIVIGNPSVLDVTGVSKKELTLSPKAAGTTTFIYWDNFGEQSFKVKVFAENAQEIKQRVDILLKTLNLPAVYTQVAEDEGKVLLLGSVKSAQERERIKTALESLRNKTVDLIMIKEEEAVVEIDVQVLELSQDATNTLGLTWPGSVSLIEKGSPGIAAAGTKWSTLFKVLNLQRGTADGPSPFTFKLDALIQEGKARILSRPRLSCQSGKEAQMLVGGEKPTFTTSTTEGGTSSSKIEYKEYGIKLSVKPIVNEDDRIKLGLLVEVSDVGDIETIGDPSAPTGKAYPLTKRSASTELFLNDGQTMAIGGLIKHKSEEDLKRVPWLSDVPVLGMFFRQRTTKTGKGAGSRDDTELFITLTPTIVSRGPDRSVRETKKLEIPAPLDYMESDVPEPLRGYNAVIQKRILENLDYPVSAKQAGFKGIVKVSLHLSYSGELLDAIVKTSSGYKTLDDNAISVAKRVGSYPPFPPSIEQKEMWIDVPIVYRLD